MLFGLVLKVLESPLTSCDLFHLRIHAAGIKSLSVLDFVLIRTCKITLSPFHKKLIWNFTLPCKNGFLPELRAEICRVFLFINSSESLHLLSTIFLPLKPKRHMQIKKGLQAIQKSEKIIKPSNSAQGQVGGLNHSLFVLPIFSLGAGLITFCNILPNLVDIGTFRHALDTEIDIQRFSIFHQIDRQPNNKVTMCMLTTFP